MAEKPGIIIKWPDGIEMEFLPNRVMIVRASKELAEAIKQRGMTVEQYVDEVLARAAEAAGEPPPPSLEDGAAAIPDKLVAAFTNDELDALGDSEFERLSRESH